MARSLPGWVVVVPSCEVTERTRVPPAVRARQTQSPMEKPWPHHQEARAGGRGLRRRRARCRAEEAEVHACGLADT